MTRIIGDAFRDVRFQVESIHPFGDDVRGPFPIEHREPTRAAFSRRRLFVPPGRDGVFPFVVARFFRQLRRESKRLFFADCGRAARCERQRDGEAHVVCICCAYYESDDDDFDDDAQCANKDSATEKRMCICCACESDDDDDDASSKEREKKRLLFKP